MESGNFEAQARKENFMNADNPPSEIASYIVRQTEHVNAGKKEKSKKNIRVYLCIAGVLAVLCGWYGIEKSASAFEKEGVAVNEIAEEETVDTTKTQYENENGQPVVNMTAMAEEVPQVQETAETREATETRETAEVRETVETEEVSAGVSIPNGDDLLCYIAKQEVSVGSEESISGLLWNYELIVAIQDRIEDAQEQEELIKEEEYRELLVTMGMNENYVSQDPEIPEYLTMTYNPLMDVELSEQELSDLLRLVEAEAPAEDIYGKILVANVVFNRVNHEKMADTVSGVIYEKIGGSAQFSPTAISWYWNSIVVTDSTREAVARCLSGEDYSDGALYFYAWERDPNKHKTVEWMKDLECLFTHGGHRFFR